jgi:hypothetical protein
MLVKNKMHNHNNKYNPGTVSRFLAEIASGFDKEFKETYTKKYREVATEHAHGHLEIRLDSEDLLKYRQVNQKYKEYVKNMQNHDQRKINFLMSKVFDLTKQSLLERNILSEKLGLISVLIPYDKDLSLRHNIQIGEIPKIKSKFFKRLKTQQVKEQLIKLIEN